MEDKDIDINEEEIRKVLDVLFDQMSDADSETDDTEAPEETDAADEAEEAGDTDENGDGDDRKDLEEVCMMCRRSESKTGPLIHMPGGITVCRDCIEKGMSAFNFGGDGNDLSKIDLSNLPFNVRMIDLSQLGGIGNLDVPQRQKVKKKKENAGAAPAITMKEVPAPHIIKGQLDEYVVGQEKAKKTIAVAVYNHYKRIASDSKDGVEIQKSNVLLIGPTGSGKTYLVQTLAKLLKVPLAIADATSLTEAGYIGDDIESVLSKLLAAADNDVEKAEQGIVYIDEIDKIAKKKNTTTRDVSGESVQQELLKMLEGARVEVPVGAGSKNGMVPLATMDTRNILFICGGAFPDLEDIIKERLKEHGSIGFQADLKDEIDEDKNILQKVTNEDLRKFGMIPEFLGRLPITVTLEALTKDFMVRILKEPKNAIMKQYEKLLAMDEVQLVFEDEALEVIAEKAMEKDTGARALRAILEEYMLDIMYEIPKDPNIGRVTITKDYLLHRGGPIIELRTQATV